MKWILAIGIFIIIACGVSVYYILTHDVKDSVREIKSIDSTKVFKQEFVSEKVTLENLFDGEKTDVPDESLTIMLTGDVMLGRKVNSKTLEKNDFTWAFEKVSEKLSDSDITVINLEGPLVHNCPTTTEGFKFCGDPRHLEGLNLAGVDIANLANNHSDNYGESGLEDTKEILAGSGIKTFNRNEHLAYNYGDQTINFLGYNVVFLESAPLIPIVKSEIAKSKIASDLVIVSFHWGDEYTPTPNSHQTNLAHAAIEAGADAVIGHHPHWIQSVEIYNDKLILYSLGNFIFDQMWSDKTKEGMATELTFYDNKLIDAELLPVLIEDYGQPYFIEGKEKRRILREVRSFSEQPKSD